ncbi:unnamed protein product [Rotaria sp. Silwood2]|nr:unnamed protein product [Rotaria sp. Silwood2]
MSTIHQVSIESTSIYSHLNQGTTASNLTNETTDDDDDFAIFQFSLKDLVNAGELQYTDKKMKDIANDLMKKFKGEFNRSFQLLIFGAIQPMMYLLKREQNLSDFLEPLKSLFSKESNNPCISQRWLIDVMMINSNRFLCRRLTFLLSKRNPVPMIQPSTNTINKKYRFVSSIIHVWDFSRPILLSFGVGKCKGKTPLVNALFETNFEQSMNSKYFRETIDVDFGYHFVERRSVNVADVHGDLSIETLKRICQLFNGFLVHVQSTYLTSNTSDVIQFLRPLSHPSYILLLIRDLDDEDDEEIQTAITSIRSACSNCQIFFLPNVADKNTYVNKEKIEQLREQIFLDAVKFSHSNEQNIQKHFEQLMDTDQCRNAEQDKVFIDSIRPILIHGKEDDYPLYSLFTRMCDIRHKLAKMDPYNADFQDTKLYALHSELFQISEELEKQQRAGFQATGQAFQRFFQLIQNKEDQLNNLNLLSIELKHERDKKISSVDSTTSFYQQLSLEIHWRNAMISSKSISEPERRILIDAYHNYIDEGNPFEIVDGDNFEIQGEFLTEVMHLFHKKKFFVMSIIGPQNSGKSTLLNFLFGTLFEVREGRCTRDPNGECAALSTDIKFVTNVQKLCKLFVDSSFQIIRDTGDRFSIPTKWIEFANSVLQIIKKYPDLTYFKDIFEREQNNKIRQDIRNDFEQILSPTQAQLLIDREKHNSISHIQDSFQIEQEKILNELESKLEQKIVKYAVSENVRQRSFRFMRVQVASRFRSWEVSAIMAGERDKLNKMVDDSDAELRQLAYDTTGKNHFIDKNLAIEKFEMMWKNQFSCVQVKFDSETQWKQSIDLVCQLYDVLDQYALPSLDNVLAYLPFLMTLDNLDQLSKISTECISKASNINPLVPHSTNTVYTICFSDLQKPYTFLNNDALLAIYCGDKNSRTRTRSTCRLGVREDFSQEMNSNWRTTVRVSHCFELLIGRIKEIYQLKISDDEFSTEIILLQDILGTVDKLIQDVNQELSMFNFSMSKSLKSILHICAVLSTALFYYHRHKTHFNSVLMKINQNKVKWQHRFLRMVVVQENDDGNVATNLINEFSDQLRQSFELKVKEIIGTCIENELRTLNQYSIMKELDGEVYEAPNDWLMRYVLYPFQIIIERFDQRWEKIETIILQLVNISMNSHLEILAEFFRIIEAIKIALQLIGGDSFTFVDDLFESSSNDINQNLFDKKLCMATLLYQYLSGEPISTKITIKNGFTYTVQSKWQETINNMPKSSDQLKNIFRSMKTTFETYTITYIDLFLDKVINQKTTSEQALQIVMNTFVKNSCRRTRERLLIQVRGCKEQCPGCKRLCDIDHQLDNATSVGQGENRHRCQSGHQIQALGGVRYAKGNELIIVSCEQMKDEEFTITDQNSSPMCWKDFKNIHLDWDFDELNLKRRQIDVSIYIWDRIANQLCQYYENDMGFVMPNYELVQDHFILLFGYSDRSNIANDGLYGRMLRRVEGLLLTTKTDVDQDRPTLRNYLPKVIDEFIRIRIEKKRFVTDRMTLIVGGPKPICLNRVARLDEINSSQINDSISNCKKPIDFLAAFMIINDVLASIQADSKLYGLKHTIILMMDGKPDKFPFNGLRELLNNYYSTINHFWTIMLGKDDIETSKQINEIMNGTLLNINEPKDLFDVYLKIANQDADKSAACNKTSLMQSTSTLDIWTEKKTALNDPKTSIEPLSQHKKPYEEKSNTQTVPIPGIPESLIYHQIYGISFPSKREDILPNVLLAIAEQVAPNTTEDILIPLPIFSQRSIDYLPTINIKLTVEPLGFDCNQFLACLAQDIGIDRNDLVLIEARQGTVSLNTRLSVRIAIDKYHCKAKRTDNGWYGQGIYFTSSPRKALNYAKSWKFDTFAYIICSLVAVGKSLTITNMDYRGKPMHPNYDSHYVRTSPNDGEPISNEGEPFYEEFVIKDNRRILPLFIVGIRRAYHCTIWRDANIDNEVNSSILEDMRRRLSFNIYESKTSEDTLNILKSKFSDDEMNCALITNGARGGRELVIECRKLRLTIPIVVYCKKKSFHQQWATELGGREIKVTGNADETVQFVMDSLK